MQSRKCASKVTLRGFTLVELLIVMAVVAILVAVIIPSFRGMQEEGWITKAEQEIQTLQTAVESYYRHNDAYPSNIGEALRQTKPQIIYKPMQDPWKTSEVVWDSVSYNTYGYITGNDSDFGDYYIIYSESIDDLDNVSWNESANMVSMNTSTWAADIVVSNGPIGF